MLGIECVSDAATLSPAPKLACWLRVRSRLCKLAGNTLWRVTLAAAYWSHRCILMKLRLLAPPCRSA